MEDGLIDGQFLIGNNALLRYYVKDGITDVIIPKGVTEIGAHAFSHCSSLTNIIIPDSVEKIGPNAFEYCTSLTSITISNSVTEIEDRTFSRCSSLTNIIIPNSVKRIGVAAFECCSNLETVIMSPSTRYISASDKGYDSPYDTFYLCDNVKIIRKNEKKINKLQTKATTIITIDDFPTIMSKIETYTNNLKELEIKSFNTENSTTMEKFGEELKDYPMILSDIYYKVCRLDPNLENKNKNLRKILDKISGDDKNTLLEKIGKLFLNEKDDEIVLNETAMDEIKTFSSKELDLYRKQTQMLESLRELIRLYIQKLSDCKQELNMVFVSDTNNEFDRIDMNSLSEDTQTIEKGMNNNLTGMLNLYSKVSNDLSLNLMYITSLKEVTTVLLPAVIIDEADKKLHIRKKESVDALREVATILKTLQSGDKISVQEEMKTTIK